MWTGFARAVRIVPWPVKWRVLRIAAMGLLLAGGLLALLYRLPQPLRTVTALPLSLLIPVAAYAGWCLWPRLRWGLPSSLLAEPPCPPDQRLRLSFDDGPTPGLTEAVLDLLRQHGVHATFFVLTHKARRCPDLVRRIIAEGHTLGLHGEDHRVALFRSAADLKASLGRARDELSVLAGQPITLYRPSHGWKNLALLRALRDLRLRLVFWDHGVWDTDAPPVEILIQRLRWATPPQDAATIRPPIRPMILLHDGRDDRLTPPAHAQALLAALAAWLPSLRQTARGGQQRL